MRFDFAISFSSPQRLLAKQIANDLVNGGFKVFFDENFEHELLGKDGADYLNNIFFKESRFCVALLSSNYDKGAWTQLERRAIQAREFTGEPSYLIPVIIDGYKPDWLLPTKIYYDLESRPLEKLIQLLSLKIEESGLGRFAVKNEILLDKVVESICKVTGRSDIINLSFQHDEENVKGGWIIRVEKDLTNKQWTSNNFFCHFVGDAVYENNTHLVGVPRYPRNNNLWFYNKANKTDFYLTIPIKGDYDCITDCILTENKLIFTIEHGESFILNLSDYSVHCFKEIVPWKEEYNGIDIPSSFDILKDDRIILGVHKIITIYNTDGGIDSQFEFPEIIHSVKMCHQNSTILITSRDFIYCVDFNTHEQKFKHRLAASFPKNISCSKNLIMIYAGFGGLDGSVELLNATTGASYFQFKSQTFEHIYYDAIISNDGNTIFFLNEKLELKNGNRERKRFITIMSRPE